MNGDEIPFDEAMRFKKALALCNDLIVLLEAITKTELKTEEVCRFKSMLIVKIEKILRKLQDSKLRFTNEEEYLDESSF